MRCLSGSSDGGAHCKRELATAKECLAGIKGAKVSVRALVTPERRLSRGGLKRFLVRAGATRVYSIRGSVRTGFETVTSGATDSAGGQPRRMVESMMRQRTRAARRLVTFQRQRQRVGRRSRENSARSRRAALSYYRALKTNRRVRYEVEGQFERKALLRATDTRTVSVARIARRDRPLVRPPVSPRAKASDDIDLKTFMPRLWTPDTGLISDPGTGPPLPPYSGPRGDFIKNHIVLVQWSQQCFFTTCFGDNGLSWYAGDDPGERGFEIEVTPADETQLWSDDWRGDHDDGSWASNLPSAYRDDLTSDPQPLPFAIGTAAGTDLDENHQYWVNFDTNEGRLDTGPVRVRGQATTRAADAFEEAYCLSHFNEDSACYFAASTEDVTPDYSLGDDPNTRAIWGACPPPYDARLESGECGYTY